MSTLALQKLPLDEISVNPHQPRRNFAPAELQELADSIEAVGLIHPPLVRERTEGKGYELVSGDRLLAILGVES